MEEYKTEEQVQNSKQDSEALLCVLRICYLKSFKMSEIPVITVPLN